MFPLPVQLAGAVPPGAGVALLAAFCWGGGDFSGGMGVKASGATAHGALRFILAAHALSLLGLVLWLCGQPAPFWSRTGVAWIPILWALAAGAVAGVSIVGFYIALARGAMGSAAAVSGLLAAALPAAVGLALEGRPGLARLAGFALAAGAIWLIAEGPAKASSSGAGSGALWLAVGGGVGFGVYFTALRFANPLGPVASLAVARVGSLGSCLLWLACMRRERTAGDHERPRAWLSAAGWRWAGATALLDSGGNLFYIAATRMGRLDVAAVLASLYPATTILLAAGVLRERPTRQQLAGMLLAAAAVVLVTR